MINNKSLFNLFNGRKGFILSWIENNCSLNLIKIREWIVKKWDFNNKLSYIDVSQFRNCKDQIVVKGEKIIWTLKLKIFTKFFDFNLIYSVF